jgi:Rha family phage regulatory protein
MNKPITQQNSASLIQLEDGEASVTTLTIANEFSRRHNNVMREIDSLVADGTIDVRDFAHISYIDELNRSQRAYRLTERAALIAMPFIGGRKSREGQKRLVDAFMAMRRILKQQDAYRATLEWQQARASGKVIRLEFTDGVAEFVDYAERQGSRNARKYYMALTKMEYRALFLVGQAVGEAFRNKLDVQQLVNLATAEAIAQRALREGMAQKMYYKDIYQLAKQRVESLAAMIGKSLPGNRTRRIAA